MPVNQSSHFTLLLQIFEVNLSWCNQLNVWAKTVRLVMNEIGPENIQLLPGAGAAVATAVTRGQLNWSLAAVSIY